MRFFNILSTDILLGLQHFLNGAPYSGLTTFIITFCSGWMVAYYSLFKSKLYKRKKQSWKDAILHVFLFGPLLHLGKLMKELWKDPTYSDSEIEEDILRMRLLEGITEAAPQV